MVAGGGSDALGDFLLDEQDNFGGRMGGGEEFLDDGGGDVVGDVAGDDVVLEVGKVKLEEILVMDGQVLTGERGGEMGGEAGVVFYGDDVGETAKQAGGEGTETGSDFQAGINSRDDREVGDLIKNNAVLQPVLTEGFLVFHRHRCGGAPG